MTQQQLADSIGINQNIISEYEKGRLRLHAEMLARFAMTLRVSADDLLGISDQIQEGPEVSLRFLKRIAIIEGFPESKKKHILRNLDDAIAAHEAGKNRD